MTGQFEEYKKLFKALVDDVIAAEEELTQSDDQLKRRTYVRTVFALIEGDTFRRKQTALSWHELSLEARTVLKLTEEVDLANTEASLHNRLLSKLHELAKKMLGVSSIREQLEKVTQVEFTDAELALIREEQYELNNKGDVRIRQKFLKLADNLRFSFKLFAKATNSSYELDVGGIGWDSFLKAIAVRNRISYPKYERDIVISDEDLDFVQKAAQWYRDCTRDLLSSASSV